MKHWTLNKRVFFVILLLCPGFIIYGQEQDPRAGELLDRFVQKTQQSEGLKSSFTFTVLDLKENTESSFEGTFDLKQDKYIVKTESMQVYFDGTTLWNYLVDVNEVNISQPDTEYQEESYFENPTRLFSLYKDDFFYTLVGEDDQESTTLNVIDLYPKDLNVGFSRIRLSLRKNDTLLYNARIFGKDGVHYILKINELNLVALDDTGFQFKPENYPGIEVIDLR